MFSSARSCVRLGFCCRDCLFPNRFGLIFLVAAICICPYSFCFSVSSVDRWTKLSNVSSFLYIETLEVFCLLRRVAFQVSCSGSEVIDFGPLGSGRCPFGWVSSRVLSRLPGHCASPLVRKGTPPCMECTGAHLNGSEVGGESNWEMVSRRAARACVHARGLVAQWNSL